MNLRSKGDSPRSAVRRALPDPLCPLACSSPLGKPGRRLRISTIMKGGLSDRIERVRDDEPPLDMFPDPREDA